MTVARVRKPDVTLVWHPAYDVQCVICGYPANRIFYYTHGKIYQVWVEHRTFGFRRDCLVQKEYLT